MNAELARTARRGGTSGGGFSASDALSTTCFVALIALAAAFAPAAAYGQSTDALLQRLERMERDMTTLQRQVYRGNAAGNAPQQLGTQPVQPIQQSKGVAPTLAAQLEVRINQLEIEIRNLTGSIEQMTYNMQQVQGRLDQLVSDVDLRLQALEGGGVATGVGGQTGQFAATETPAAQQGAEPGQLTIGQYVSDGQGGVKVLTPEGQALDPDAAGQAAANAAATPAATQAATQTAAVGPALPEGPAEDQYRYAFQLLRQSDYARAERAFSAFVQSHPQDSLTGNAYYWLGETFYVRQDYRSAAVAFAEGYQKHHDNPKAPDSLLKLAMSLANLEKTAESCTALTQLTQEFPDAPTNIKTRASREKQRIGCN